MPKKGSSPEYTQTVPAVDQALRILFFMAKSPHPKLSLTEICKGVGIHKSKGYSILNTLIKYGLVSKDTEDKQYTLGLGLLSLSRKVIEDLDLRKLSLPYLEKIAAITKKTAIFGIIFGENLVVVAKKETENPINVTIRLGSNFHVTYGAHGRAIAAFLGEKELNSLLKRKKIYFFGSPSNFDKKRFEDELQKCRLKGYACDIGELYPGISAIAVPVFSSKMSVIGVFIVLGAYGEDKVEEYGKVLLECAKEFSLSLGADPKLTYDKYKKGD
ncbi:MAG: IclR family transcriptional regulator [Desulfobacterota bacterium]|nr:IclR family transcriptional regulator [Thermodesulfobacteriota bacterium]MDW8001633.1 IclR family transcriptional regulator [Deltaproteobacteria bacterium]